jgi:hypothetical protein
MTIPEREKILAIAIPSVLLAGFLAFVGYGWMQEHDARLKAEAETGQQQKQIDGLKEQQTDAQKALNEKVTALEKLRQTPATANQLASDASTLLPNLRWPCKYRRCQRIPRCPMRPRLRL